MKKGQNINHPTMGSSVRVDPIKYINDIKAIEKILKDNPRNLALFTLGIHTGLRIKDLLEIRKGQVRDVKPGDEITIRIQGSDEAIKVSLNEKSVNVIQQLVMATQNVQDGNIEPEDYLFSGRNGKLSVSAVNNLVKKWCAAVNLRGNYGCHSLRKTFGYLQLVHFGSDLPEVMAMLNHSNPLQTLEYIDLLPEILETIKEKDSIANQAQMKVPTKKIKNSEKNRTGFPSTGEALWDNKEIYKLIFENANDMIICTDKEGYILDVNNKLDEMYGYQRQDFLGKHFSEITTLVCTTETKKTIDKDYKKTIANGNTLGRMPEFQVLHKNGTPVVVETNTVFFKEGDEVVATITIVRDITERKQVEEKLRKAHDELEYKVKERTASLEEMNSALKVLLEKRDEDRTELEEKVLFNIKKLIVPTLDKLKKSKMNERENTLLSILETNLNDIISPFVKGVSIRNLKLTPTEIQVANFLKQNKSTKEIADLLYISESAIVFHRHNIRKKLGLVKQKVNLKSYLQNID